MAGETLQGTRLPDAVIGEKGPGWDAWNKGRCPPGSYMKVTTGSGTVMWWIVDPLGVRGSIVKQHHSVEEHEDGTITVRPSLLHQRVGDDDEAFSALVNGDATGWHGWLERGVWRSV